MKFFYNDENYCAVYTIETSYMYFNLQYYPHRWLSITKNRMFMFTPVIYFRKPSILGDPFNKEIQKYREVGLIKYWSTKYRNNRKDKVTKKKKPIQMCSIMIIVKIGALTYLISFIVFILELYSTKFLRIRRVLDSFTY